MKRITIETINVQKNNGAVGSLPEFGRWQDVPADGRRPVPAALSITRLRQMGRAAGPEFTTTPVQEGALPGGLPEFTRIKTTTYFTGLSRGKIYVGIKEGWIRSVSLRKKGQRFSVRLIHLPSLLEYLRSLMVQQQVGGANE
jgi:hypothetical protein